MVAQVAASVACTVAKYTVLLHVISQYQFFVTYIQHRSQNQKYTPTMMAVPTDKYSPLLLLVHVISQSQFFVTYTHTGRNKTLELVLI